MRIISHEIDHDHQKAAKWWSWSAVEGFEHAIFTPWSHDLSPFITPDLFLVGVQVFIHKYLKEVTVDRELDSDWTTTPGTVGG